MQFLWPTRRPIHVLDRHYIGQKSANRLDRYKSVMSAVNRPKYLSNIDRVYIGQVSVEYQSTCMSAGILMIRCINAQAKVNEPPRVVPFQT